MINEVIVANAIKKGATVLVPVTRRGNVLLQQRMTGEPPVFAFESIEQCARQLRLQRLEAVLGYERTGVEKTPFLSDTGEPLTARIDYSGSNYRTLDGKIVNFDQFVIES